MLQKTHKTRFPFLTNSASVSEWREAKRILDGEADSKKARDDMYEAFGCHGEPIADAIETALDKLAELCPEHTRQRASADRIVGKAYAVIGDAMSDVRSELDQRLTDYVSAQRTDAIESVCSVSGSDLYARDHGVDLNTSLEDAFECGVDAAARYLEDASCHDDSGSHTLDDL